MKKFFEKHDLFKIIAILLIVVTLFTWIFRVAFFQNGELVTFNEKVEGVASIVDESTVGVFDLNAYIILIFYIFSNTFVFLFLVHALNKMLGKSKAYATIVGKFANLFKGKEIVYCGISMLFYAFVASICNDYLVTLLFIPFTISVLNRLKVDKVSALATTFGGVMIGMLGATYSSTIVGSIINYGGVAIKYGNEMVATIITSLIAFIALLSLVGLRIKSSDNKDVVEDKFITAEEFKKTKKKKSKSIIPMAITLGVFAIIVILGFIPWESFKITAFTKLHENVMNATLFGANYPKILLGTAQMSQTSYSINALGTWDITSLSAFLILMLFVFKVMAGIKLDDMIDSIGDGLRLAIKPAIILGMIYSILAISVSFPVIPMFINGINKAFSANALKPIGWLLNVFIATLFNGDVQYTMSTIGGLFSTFSNETVVGYAMQAFYAFSSFIAPTSIALDLGLNMLDVKVKDYFKFIWKFLIALLVVVLAVVYILLFV